MEKKVKKKKKKKQTNKPTKSKDEQRYSLSREYYENKQQTYLERKSR